MTQFNFANHTAYGASPHEKMLSLARDFLRAQKPIDWVISQCCGEEPKATAKIISMARGESLISQSESDQLLKRYKINKDGKRVK